MDWRSLTLALTAVNVPDFVRLTAKSALFAVDVPLFGMLTAVPMFPIVLCRRWVGFALQVEGCHVAGGGKMRRRSSFFRQPATVIGLLCVLVSQADRFWGTCDSTGPYLRHTGH